MVLEAPGPWPPSAEGSPWRQTMLTTSMEGPPGWPGPATEWVLCVSCAVPLVGGLATSCPWPHLCLWCISLVTDSDPCVTRALTVSLGSTAGRAREAERDRGRSRSRWRQGASHRAVAGHWCGLPPGQRSLGHVGSWRALTVSVWGPVSPVGTHASVPGGHLGEGHRLPSLGGAD